MEQHIPLHLIDPNPQQPRASFDHDSLQELSQSLVETSQVQNITVEQSGDRYILIDGERRLRAAQIAGLPTLRATVIQTDNGLSPTERATMAMVANLQRRDLNPIEEAQTYLFLHHQCGLSINQISRKCGLPITSINNRLIWTKLEPEIQKLVRDRVLYADARIAQALLTIPSPQRVEFAQKIAARPGITIRALLNAIQRLHDVITPLGDEDIPAFRISRLMQSAQPTGWTALQQSGKLPPWKHLVDQVRHTCNACPLADQAGPTTCKDCPMVDFINRLCSDL